MLHDMHMCMHMYGVNSERHDSPYIGGLIYEGGETPNHPIGVFLGLQTWSFSDTGIASFASLIPV